MAEEGRPRKTCKVEQNHRVRVSSINTHNMDHFCTVLIDADHMNPGGLVKRGIRINVSEFSKGIRVLSERCGYRLLSPLSSFAYSNYLHKATEEFMKNGTGDGPAKPVVEVFNHSPFRYKSHKYVAVSSTSGQKVFELFEQDVNSCEGFAREVERADLPFTLNWSGPKVKEMEVNDGEVLAALTKLIGVLDDLQPNIKGLGVCSLCEFGRFHIYNLLVDSSGDNLEDTDDDSDNEDQVDLVGYKQMLVCLQSTEVETGKSFLSEIATRLFYGKKKEILSTISFNSAKTMLGNGEPIIIDDFNNDQIGMVLISRASKSIWGKAQIKIRNESITPKANLMFCTNEEISNLRVEGTNKDEIYRKFSVIDLGEHPMGKSSKGNKAEKIREAFELAKVIRKYLPSYYGLMLSVCGKYITPDQLSEYSDITKHERLGNILQNVKNFHEKLNVFCDKKDIVKPESIENKLDTSCLTNKSELVFTFKSPDQIVEILISNGVKLIITEHDQKQGIAFELRSLSKYPWCKESLKFKKDGVKVFSSMRTRQLGEKVSRCQFLAFDCLRSAQIEKIEEYVQSDEDIESGEDVDPRITIAESFESACLRYDVIKKQRFIMAEKYIKDLTQFVQTQSEISTKCVHCGFVAKSKRGLTQHSRRCQKRIDSQD